MIQRRFSTFKTVDDETKLAFELAKRMATEVLLEKPIHMVLSGKSGVEKSHLAMATAGSIGKIKLQQTMLIY